MNSGVWPFLFARVICAPFSSSNRTMSIWPLLQAVYSGVSLQLFIAWRSISAPLSSNICASLMLPSWQTMCNGVAPAVHFKLEQWISAPFSNNSVATAMLLFKHAIHNSLPNWRLSLKLYSFFDSSNSFCKLKLFFNTFWTSSHYFLVFLIFLRIFFNSVF